MRRSPSQMSAKVCAAELLRRDDGHRVVDAGGTHRTRRRDVHDDAATALRACTRHRRAGHPARTGARSSRCAPRPTTKRPTPPTDEPLWNESWYADFADAAQGFGGWIRLGLIPNQQTAWMHALLCGPDLPTVAVVDFEVPLPADPWVVRTRRSISRHAASTPLQSYRIDLRGQGQSYPDPAALLRGEPGTPVEVKMDLVGPPTARPISTGSPPVTKSPAPSREPSPSTGGATSSTR